MDIKTLREENNRRQAELRAEIAERQTARERGELPDDGYADWRQKMAARQVARDRGEILHTDFADRHSTPVLQDEPVEQSQPLTDFEKKQVSAYIDTKLEELRTEMIDEVADALNQVVDDANTEIQNVLRRLGSLEEETRVRHSVTSDGVREHMAEIRKSMETMQSTISEACSRADGVLPFAPRKVN